MRRIKCVVCVLLVFWLCDLSFAAERSEFRYKAGIESGAEFEMPIRLTLSHEIIAETSNTFADLRLFDDSGTEIPYIIYTQRLPEQEPQRITWKVVEYHYADDIQTIVLKRIEQEGTVHTLMLNTAARDFEKAIEVSASTNRIAWQWLASGEVFDFSSHVDLRKTSVELPESDADYLKVILRNVVPSVESQENLRFRYKDLEFSVEGQQTGEIKIDAFVSHLVRKQREKVHFDEVIFSNPGTSTDQDGNTLVNLGRVNLPIERLTLSIKNAYFYRRIELWTAETDDDEAYIFRGSGIVYKIPGIRELQNVLVFNQPQHAYVRLKIINHDNPPLQVDQVKVEWPRRNLYFIPEQGRHYTLYCNGRNIQKPRYELQNIVPDRFDKLMRYPEWNVIPLQKNETYLPKPEERPQAALEKYWLTGLILLLALGLGLWTLQLMKKIPGHRNP